MNKTRLIAVTVALLAGRAVAQEMPIRFATSEAKVTVRLPEGTEGPVVLRALGRNWTEPAAVRNGSVEFTVPTVRVPLAFDVVTAEAKRSLVRLVVYPPKYKSAWDEKVPLYVDADAPAWLTEWAAAAGLPVKTVKLGTSPVGADRPPENGGLLIVGQGGAGKASGELVERQAQWQINVLVLEASWFGARNEDEFRVGKERERFGHGLAVLKQNTWPQELAFRGAAGPWPGVANRWVWLDGPSSPLVEEVRTSQKGRLVFNYIPWPQQLGVETADAVFLAILNEAARRDTAEKRLDRSFVVVWPPVEQITATSRPVLAACLRENLARRTELGVAERAAVRILDLCGPALSSNEAAGLPEISQMEDWIVLGSDPEVVVPPPAEATESGAEVKKQRVRRVEEDALPQGTRSQVRLMQILTDEGVFIGQLKMTRSNP